MVQCPFLVYFTWFRPNAGLWISSLAGMGWCHSCTLHVFCAIKSLPDCSFWKWDFRPTLKHLTVDYIFQVLFWWDLRKSPRSAHLLWPIGGGPCSLLDLCILYHDECNIRHWNLQRHTTKTSKWTAANLGIMAGGSHGCVFKMYIKPGTESAHQALSITKYYIWVH